MERKRTMAIGYVVSAVAAAVILFIGIECFFVPVNLTSKAFWILMLTALIPMGAVDFLLATTGDDNSELPVKITAFGYTGLFIIFLVLLIAGSPLFYAKKYAGTIGDIESADFAGTVSENVDLSKIALMDTATAKSVGSRQLGSLDKTISSQLEVGDYVQQVVNGQPVKVAPLDYTGLMSYLHNKETGTFGYVVVNASDLSAKVVKVDGGIKYTSSAAFDHKVDRVVRNAFPTTIFGRKSFELDESGHPFWIFQTGVNQTILGNWKVTGVVTVDAVTGSVTRYGVSDIPVWVDTVFDGDYITDKYNAYGRYAGGFWNGSLFGSRSGCTQTTLFISKGKDSKGNETTSKATDFGYVVDANDVWIFTGITSMNNSDNSDLGMLMANERTGEVKYFAVPGADEQSAMEAAEGELQQYGYGASFPTLINVSGEPVYIMVMTDNSRIIKSYAVVSMQDRSHLSVGKTAEEALSKFGGSLSAVGTDEKTSVTTPSDAETVTSFKVENGTIYLTLSDGTVKIFQMK